MNESGPSRRRFVARLVVALNALVAAIIATPAIAYVLSPLWKRRVGQWVAIDQVSNMASDLPAGGSRSPRQVTYQYRQERGYTVEEIRRAAFVIRDGDTLVVLSPVCTHMGCNVGFNDATKLFECPCHGGKYDASGGVVAGPPARPLQRFLTRERDGNLEIYVT